MYLYMYLQCPGVNTYFLEGSTVDLLQFSFYDYIEPRISFSLQSRYQLATKEGKETDISNLSKFKMIITRLL